MTRPKVFIASSSEGEEIAKKVQSLLQTKLNQQATVELWTSAFELSATYIESLETVADEADFAVLLLTPDDVTTSRKKKKSAPRDNGSLSLAFSWDVWGGSVVL